MPNTEIKSKIWFFTEQNGITQGASQAFGPVAGNEQNEFRLTAKFSCTNKKAYSVCKGIALIVPQAGSSDKVNLLLRPYSQPYPGINIKYFVYRGLRKADFFTTATDPLVIPKVNTVTNDLINKVNEDFDDFYSVPLKDVNGNPIPKPAFLAKFIGYETNAANSKLISDYFFKESVINGSTENDAFELPLVDGGKWIGNFDGECGMDVVINYGDYKHAFDNGEFVFDLGYAKAAEAKITLAGTDYEKKLLKEQTVQFLDAAAYFGLFAEDGRVEIFNGGSSAPKEGVNIYNDVLNGFHTRNNWYIYIQSDRGRSYGFYGNYQIADGNSNQLKIGIAENALAEAQYNTHGWPLLVNTQQQQPVVSRNKVYLQLVTDNNNDVALYVQTGSANNARQGKFYGYSDLVSEDKGKITRSILLTCLAAADGKDIATISSFIYKGNGLAVFVEQTIDSNANTIDLYRIIKPMDDVFGFLQGIPVFAVPSSEFRIKETRPVLFSHSFKGKQIGITVSTICKIADIVSTDDVNEYLHRISFIAEPFSILTNTMSGSEKIEFNQASSPGSGKKVSDNGIATFGNVKLIGRLFQDGKKTINGLRISTKMASNAGYIMLGISMEEKIILENLIDSDLVNPGYVFSEQAEEVSAAINSEKITYKKFHLSIVAENENALVLKDPPENIIVYTLDGNCYFSEMYSKYVSHEIQDEKKFVER